MLKKRIITSNALKMDRFVARKRDGEKCENNINQKLRTSGTKPNKISKNRCTLVINFSFLF
jgi:hypothetical protein